MRKIFKRVASSFLIPITRWYVKKERTFSYQEITILVKPSVFHPGLFSSTLFLAKYLETQSLKDQTFLEVGSGSGLLSIIAAKKGAQVTALDLNPVAVETTKFNAAKNNCLIKVVTSDLFDSVSQKYQWIVVNPPFYAKAITDNENLAWNCGIEFQYFLKFFDQLPNHITELSKVIMVLTKGCDLPRIISIADKAGFHFQLIAEKNVLFDEKNYIYQINKKSN